ncbi:MAG: polyprenyl synthetase family protein [Pseudomonadales bacterium]|nr:polyprenyl synthetase family protein [Pseudomonadales bacterium]
MQLDTYLASAKVRVDECLSQAIDQQLETTAAYPNSLQRLAEASHYATANGGKRIRPALFFATLDALEETGLIMPNAEDCALIASSIECIHSYSLVHDDLPAMDDDDLRRGQASCHIAYDEATAILVGDGLQALAFELLSQTQLPATIQIQLVQALAQAAGNQGMVGGQAIDLASENQTITLTALEQLHRLKTGALIRAAVLMAAISMNASPSQRDALAQFANAVGLAFQVHDDVLDIESDTATLGKTQGADLALNKSTYPKLIGLAAAKAKASALLQQSLAALDQLGGDAEALRMIARFAVERQH